MSNIWIIARKEFNHYFISPIAYAVVAFILLVLGIIFFASILGAIAMTGYYQQQAPGVNIIVGPLVTIFLFTTPAITMHTIAEEQRSGTLELLLTAPVRDWELVIGKWLGSFMFTLTIIAITIVYPLILNQLVQPGIDQGLLITNYLGLVLLMASFVAIGVATSSLFSNQIAAMFATLGVLMVLWMISYPAQMQGGSGGGEVFKYLDFGEHFFNTFVRGVIEVKDIIYFISVTSLALFLGTIFIQVRRWR